MMEKICARIELTRFESCPVCGESTRFLTYRSDDPKPACDSCIRNRKDYVSAEMLLRITPEVSRMVKTGLLDNRFSAWYIYGDIGVRERIARECIPWSHDRLGRPVFDSRAAMKDVLAVKGECIGTLIAVPSLQTPPSAGNLKAVAMTSTPLVCLMDCRDPSISSAVLKHADGKTTRVLVAVEDQSQKGCRR